MTIEKYSILDNVIKATSNELIDFLNDFATHKGQHSWLVVPENSKNKMCLVAHIDTVFQENKEKNIIKEEFHWTSPQGICGDDRAGVFSLLKIYMSLEDEFRPMLLFTDGEERGGYGAREACKIFNEYLNNVTFFVELDRHGYDDMVFYNYEPHRFKEHIGKYGFVERMGSFSDITILGRHFQRCAVNLSIGYFNEHSLREHIDIRVIKNTIVKVLDMCVDESGNTEIWENQFQDNFSRYKMYREQYEWGI